VLHLGTFFFGDTTFVKLTICFKGLSRCIIDFLILHTLATTQNWEIRPIFKKLMCSILVYVAQFELQVFVDVFGNINSYHHFNYIYLKPHILLHTQKKWIVLLKECNPNPNTSITKQSLVWHLTLWKIYFSCYNILNKNDLNNY
jgi:hypothetical protein